MFHNVGYISVLRTPVNGLARGILEQGTENSACFSIYSIILFESKIDFESKSHKVKQISPNSTLGTIALNEIQSPTKQMVSPKVSEWEEVGFI